MTATSDRPLRLFIVAGEHSGDALGARLMTALSALRPGGVTFEGVGGPKMVAAGLASLFPMSDIAVMGPAGVLYDIVVDPAHRGSGIGAALLTAVIEKLVTLGAPRIVLSTAVRNHSAQRLFERAGFRPTMLEMTRES